MRQRSRPRFKEFARSNASKESKLFDGASDAISRLSARRSSRRILLLLSESRDRGSAANLNDVAFLAQQAGVVVYAAQYSAFRTGFTRKSIESAGPAPRDQSGRPNPEHGTPSGEPPKDLYDPKLPPPAQRLHPGSAERVGPARHREVH